MDKVNVIRDRLKAAKDRQKSYADKRRKDLEFEVEDRVFLKLSLEGCGALWETREAKSSLHWTF